MKGILDAFWKILSEFEKNKHFGGVLVGSILLALCILCGLVGKCEDSERRRNGPSDVDIKLEGRERLNRTLRDPDSLQIIEEQVVRPGKNGGRVGYYVKYRAKNGFGGYTIDEFYTK